MTGRDDDLHERAAAYALGALDPAELREFEALLARSPEAREVLAAYREVAGLLPLGAGAPAPDPALRDKVIARATAKGRRSPKVARPSGREHYLLYALAASVMAAALFGGEVWRVGRERDALATQIAEVRRELAGRDSVLAEVFAPGVELHRLTTATPDTPEVQLFWNRQRQVALVHALRLPPLEPGRTYQLWLIPEGGAPIPSSLFVPGPDGVALVPNVRVPTLERGRYAAFAVTVEPAGGSPAPTTAPRFVAALPS